MSMEVIMEAIIDYRVGERALAINDDKRYATELMDIDRLGKGDSDLWRLLVEQNKNAIFNLAYRITGNREDAQEVLQDTFVQAYRNIRSFRGDASLLTWLLKIAGRLAVQKSKERKRYGGHSEFDEASGTRTGDPSQIPENSFLKRELGSLLEAHIGRLAPPFKAVLIMREIHGLSYKEIADSLSISIGTVESRLFRARQELRKGLAEYV